MDQSADYNSLSAKDDWGYHSSFNPHDLSAAIGYNVEVHKGLRVGVSANYGLTNASIDLTALGGVGNHQFIWNGNKTTEK
mgnify:CR=1 FL=1